MAASLLFKYLLAVVEMQRYSEKPLLPPRRAQSKTFQFANFIIIFFFCPTTKKTNKKKALQSVCQVWTVGELNHNRKPACFIPVPSSITSGADNFLQRKIASEVRHLMRQCKCHARWLSLLIRPNSSHFAFDQEVSTGSLGPVNCFQYQWTHWLAVDSVAFDKNHICSVTFLVKRGPLAFKVCFCVF